ncbi:MAG: hypothetical protein Q9191_008341, partial [Dirinaria sp. TL-2023a]
GDSYTSTGFDPNGAQPSRSNPIGNPAYPGDTNIGSPDWINYITVQFNRRFTRLFNFAYAGGTIDDLVDPSPFGALSFRQQVKDRFLPRYQNGGGGWAAQNSLFAIWFGMNDVMLNNAKPNASAYIDALTESYIGELETLHNAGARNFVLLNIPPLDRIPPTMPSTPTTSLSVRNTTVSLYLKFTPEERRQLKQHIDSFNTAMQTMTNMFRVMYPDSTVWLFDTNDLFNRVLDNPDSYRISSIISYTDRFCAPYAQSPDPKLFRRQCIVSRDRYFWADGLHPTSTVHELIAQQVVQALGSAPGSSDQAVASA